MDTTIRICTWNVHYGIELPGIISTITGNNSFANLDFLMLQEASIHKGKEDADVIAKILGNNYTFFQVTAQTFKGIPQANALIWNTQKIEIDAFHVLEMPPFHQESRLHKPYKRIFDNKHRLAIVLKSIFQKRISLVIEGKIYGHTCRVYVVHFDVIGLASRKKQMSFILKDTNQRKKVDLEIIAGDINTFKYFKLPNWNAMRNVAENAGFKDLTTDIEWTYSDKHLPKRFLIKHKLDAIFIREHLPFRYESWSLDVPGSDHMPVFANVTLP